MTLGVTFGVGVPLVVGVTDGSGVGAVAVAVAVNDGRAIGPGGDGIGSGVFVASQPGVHAIAAAIPITRSPPAAARGAQVRIIEEYAMFPTTLVVATETGFDGGGKIPFATSHACNASSGAILTLRRTKSSRA